MVELGNGSGALPQPWRETQYHEFMCGIAAEEGGTYLLAFRFPDGTTESFRFGPLLIANIFGQYERLREANREES